MSTGIFRHDGSKRRTPRTTGHCFDHLREISFRFRPEVERKIDERQKLGLCIACGKNPCACKRKRDRMLKSLPKFYMTQEERDLGVGICVTPEEYEKRKAAYYATKGVSSYNENSDRQIAYMKKHEKYKSTKELRAAIRELGIKLPKGTTI